MGSVKSGAWCCLVVASVSIAYSQGHFTTSIRLTCQQAAEVSLAVNLFNAEARNTNFLPISDTSQRSHWAQMETKNSYFPLSTPQHTNILMSLISFYVRASVCTERCSRNIMSAALSSAHLIFDANISQFSWGPASWTMETETRWCITWTSIFSLKAAGHLDEKLWSRWQ